MTFLGCRDRAADGPQPVREVELLTFRLGTYPALTRACDAPRLVITARPKPPGRDNPQPGLGDD